MTDNPLKNSSKDKLSVQEFVSYFVDHGFIIVPLIPRSKVPIASAAGWQKLEYDPFFDPNTIQGNYGVVLQEDDLVIDVDKRNFKEGVNSYHKLKAAIDEPGLSKDTFVVRTGSGRGFHIYLKKPPDLDIIRSCARFPGVEFKSKGQYVVGPGCKHPDTGKKYTVGHGELKFIKKAPDRLLRLLKRSIQPILEGTNQYVEDTQTISRFMEYCCVSCSPAIQGEEGDKATLMCALHGKDLGLSPETVEELMDTHYNPRCEPPWDRHELHMKVRNAFKYGRQAVGVDNPLAQFEKAEDIDDEIDKLNYERTQDGKKKRCLRNCVLDMRRKKYKLNGLLAYNEFSKDIEFIRKAPFHSPLEDPTHWRDKDTVNLKYYLASLPEHSAERVEYTSGHIIEAALQVASYNHYHPVKEFLENLTWDGKNRLDTWLFDYGRARGQEEYIAAVGARTLIGAVARIFEPGVKFDTMLVLEGPQGIFKSTACEVLSYQWGGVLHHNDLAHKDVVDFMRGKWIVEMAELQALNKTETKTIKNFLSRPTDRTRLAYARFTEDFPRQCIFIGTHNPSGDNGWIKDPTGGRRFWPVAVEGFDISQLTADRDQLWAEAVFRYRRKEPFHLKEPRLEAMARGEQAERTPSDPWTEVIATWLDHGDFGERRDIVSGAEVYTQCIGGPARAYGRLEQHRISGILKDELGWVKGTHYHPTEGRPVAGYKRPDDIIDIDSIIP